jgi:putative transposase
MHCDVCRTSASFHFSSLPAAALYRGYRFPPGIISYAVWLYLRFSLSLRDVEELLAERGVVVTYETIGQ